MRCRKGNGGNCRYSPRPADVMKGKFGKKVRVIVIDGITYAICRCVRCGQERRVRVSY